MWPWRFRRHPAAPRRIRRVGARPRVHHGRDGALLCFASLAHIEIHRFTPKDFLAGDKGVVVLLDVEITVRSTGRQVVEKDEIHIWRFDHEARITRFRHGVDSHGHQKAFDG